MVPVKRVQDPLTLTGSEVGGDLRGYLEVLSWEPRLGWPVPSRSSVGRPQTAPTLTPRSPGDGHPAVVSGASASTSVLHRKLVISLLRSFQADL